MGMIAGSEGGDEDEVISVINTTPLVDVMLVLLIIFLITIPVVTATVPVALPTESNQTLRTTPENINLSVDVEGNVYWNLERVRDQEVLQRRLNAEALKMPQPEIHIRADRETRYDHVNQVVSACQRASIYKIAFISEPPPAGG